MTKRKTLHLPLLIGVLIILPTVACGQGDQRLAAPRAASTTVGMTLRDFTARRERRMLAADIDGDERVSRAEFLASARSATGDPARRFGKLDRNADGVLDRQEIDAVAFRRFRRLDADADGIVTAAERSSGKAAAKRTDPED